MNFTVIQCGYRKFPSTIITVRTYDANRATRALSFICLSSMKLFANHSLISNPTFLNFRTALCWILTPTFYTTGKVTEKDTYTGNEDQNNYATEGQRENKEPLNPEDIAEHEPTAVKRDKNQGSSGNPV